MYYYYRDPGRGCGYVLLMIVGIIIVGIISPKLGAIAFIVFLAWFIIRFIISLFKD